MDFNQGNETALHASARIRSQKKIELLLQHGADPNILWIGETYRGIEQKYTKLKSQTLYRIPLDVNHAKELVIVQACRQFMYKNETRLIVFHISKILNEICETVSQLSLIKFHSIISGSFHENTKCHQPDELDFVFWTKSNIRDYEHIAIRIYNCIDSLIRSSHPSTHFPDSRLQLVCLCFGNKIQSLLFR